MKKLLAFILLLPYVSMGATGNTNLVGAWIEPDGMTMSVIIGGDTSTSFGTNLFFNNGLYTRQDTNYNALVGTQKCVITITSTGFENNSTSQRAVIRTNVLTKLRRMPYPSHGTNWVYSFDAAGTNIYARIAGDEYIYSGETLTMTASGGWIANTTTVVNVGAVFDFPVTNTSALTFQNDSEPSINWAHPGLQRWTNSIENVYLKGGHWSGIAGISVRAIDQNANTQTVWAENISTSPGRGGKKGYYVARIPTTTFSNFNTIRVDYTVYPMVGTNVFDTRLDRWTGLTPLPSSQTNFFDRFNSLTNIAVVSLTGNDSNGAATNGSPVNVDPAQYFFTVNAAFNRLAATNFQRFSVGQAIGTVYVKSGITNWSGGSLSASNAANAWTIIRNYPGDVVALTNRTGSTDVSGAVKFEGDTSGGGSLTLAFGTGVSVPFNGANRVWCDNVTLDCASTAVFFSNPLVYLTDCRLLQFGQGLVPAGVNNTSFALMRDCDVSGINWIIWPRTGIGIYGAMAGKSSFQLTDTRPGHITPHSAHTIITDSEFYQFGNVTPVLFGATSATVGDTNNVLHGFWMENCIFESTNNPSSVAVSMWNYSHITNVVIKNTVIQGARQLNMYNDATNRARTTVHFYNNIFNGVGFANDVDGLYPQGTNSISVLHMVGSHGNLFVFPVGVTAHGWPSSEGVNNIFPGLSGGNRLATNYVRFQNNQGYLSAATLGLGDYRLRSSTEIFAIPGIGRWPVHQPDAGFDIRGLPRSIIDPPGAHVDGNIRKAGIGF